VEVRNAMTRDVTTVEEETPLADALQIMVWRRIRHLPVIRGGKVVGVLAERDVLARMRPGESPFRVKARVVDVMRAPPSTIQVGEDLEMAAGRMAQEKVGSLIVLEGDALAGIVTSTDVLWQMSNGASAERPAIDPSDWSASDVMSTHVIAVHPGDYLSEAAARMVRHGIRHLPVVDGANAVVGIVSDRDVRSALGDPRAVLEKGDADRRRSSLRVSDAMTEGPHTIGPDAKLADIAAIFEDEHVGAVPVVEGDETLLGIVSYLDLVRVLRTAL